MGAIRFSSVRYSGATTDVYLDSICGGDRISLGTFVFPFDFDVDNQCDYGTFYFYVPLVDQTFEEFVFIPPTPTVTPTNPATPTVTPTITKTKTTTLKMTILFI